MEDAFHIFAQHDYSFLPVVKKDDSTMVVGYLKEADLVTAYEQHILKERVLSPHIWICHLPAKK